MKSRMHMRWSGISSQEQLARHSKCLEAEGGLQTQEGSLMHNKYLLSTVVLDLRPPSWLLQNTCCKKGIPIRKDVGMRS